MQTFILIHGAWHASWCWERVAKSLLHAGHHVMMPDLPGHGKNMRPATAVHFNDYVTHIADLIKQQHTPVTLVGHSMAGLIISQVAELMPDQIQELVFVSGYIPQHQQSLLSLADELASREVSPFLIVNQKQKALHLKSDPELKKVFFNFCNAKDADDAFSKIQSQPLQPFTHTVSLGDAFNRVAKKSLVCRYDRAIYLADQLHMSKQVTDNIVYLDADHAAYFSAATHITKALLPINS